MSGKLAARLGLVPCDPKGVLASLKHYTSEAFGPTITEVSHVNLTVLSFEPQVAARRLLVLGIAGTLEAARLVDNLGLALWFDEKIELLNPADVRVQRYEAFQWYNGQLTKLAERYGADAYSTEGELVSVHDLMLSIFMNLQQLARLVLPVI